MAKKIVKKTTTKKKPAPKKKTVVKKAVLKPAKKAIKPAPKTAQKTAKPVVIAQKTEVKAEVPVTPQAPVINRAPERKIFSQNGTIRVIAKQETAVVPPAPAVPSAPVIKPVEAKAVEVKTVEVKSFPENKVIETKVIEKKMAQKFAWDSLPKYLPAQVRFLIQSSLAECRKADSPFPFSKFIQSLPETICGLEFAFLLLSLEHSDEAIAALCKLGTESASKILENACSNFSDKFSNGCQDMTRKLRTQLAGSGQTMDSLIEQFFIQKVDRNFQIMLGAVILKSLGVKNLNYQPTAVAC